MPWFTVPISVGYFLGRFFFFYNPFTRGRIDHGLDTFLDDSFSALCFASPPNSSHRQVVSGTLLNQDGFILATNATLHSSMHVPRVVEKQRLSPRNSLVFHRGLYYCLVGAGVVGVFVFKDEKFDYDYAFHNTKLFECGTEIRHSFLIEVDEKLLGIFDYQGIRVMDIERFEWSPVGDEDLRDKILYVSYKGSFVQCDDTTKGVGNKIYFPAIVNGGGVYYCLDTRKYHTPSCELDEIKDYGDSMTWIAPTTTEY